MALKSRPVGAMIYVSPTLMMLTMAPVVPPVSLGAVCFVLTSNKCRQYSPTFPTVIPICLLPNWNVLSSLKDINTDWMGFQVYRRELSKNSIMSRSLITTAFSCLGTHVSDGHMSPGATMILDDIQS